MLLLFIIFGLITMSDASVRSAMSIDLGVEFMKMALVKPGVPMETILNRESQRKTPFALTIRNDERFFGDEALKKAISAPKHTFLFFLDLIGKPFEDPAISDYQKRFPHLVLKKNEQRGSVDFVTDAGQLPIETLLAMVLTNSRAEVEAYAGNPVKDAVIAIPGFFGISERKAIEAAAKIAGINLIRLLSAGASAALNYGVFHFKDITEHPSTHLIYDVGSTKVQSTLVRLQLYNESLQIPAQETNSTETSSAETNKTAPATTTKTSGEPQPRLEVVGHGFDANLGGLHLTLKVRDYLIEQFRKQHSNLKDDIAENPQAMAKLLKEAGKVKQVLSANTETFAQIESVFQDLDFRTKITREQLEEMFVEFEERYMLPIKNGLEMAKIEVDKLDKILLMGAGTRVPKIQEMLTKFFDGKQLSRNLNTDEAVALGAIYQAALESKVFIIKRRFDLIDIQPSKSINITDEAQKEEKMEVDETIYPKQMSDSEIAEAKKLLTEFEKREKAKVERDVALNSLESTVFDYASKLDENEEEFIKYGTEEELKDIGKRVAELREWLEDVPSETDAKQFKDRKRELTKPVKRIQKRKQQKEERPQHMKTLEAALDEADKQFLIFRNMTEVFIGGELETYSKQIADLRNFFQSAKSEVEKLPDNKDASFSTDDLKTKSSLLTRETKFLFNKVLTALRVKEEAERAAKKAAEEAEAKLKAEEEAKAVAAGEDEGEKIEAEISPEGEENKIKEGGEEGDLKKEDGIKVEEKKVENGEASKINGTDMKMDVDDNTNEGQKKVETKEDKKEEL
uniref:Hypoxia up-regulated protein 1 n=1 Tax=Meloidogyne incognita TaxID=6306 RepID=A0A914NH58_MELIC